MPEKKVTITIYCITNTTNGKKYVGQTKYSILQRRSKHIWLALKRGANTRFYEAIRKYGESAFDQGELLQECDNQIAADAAETAWIKALDTMNPEKGYNMMSGGSTMIGNKLSPEACEKISASKRGKELTARRERTKIEDAPIVELFKSGVSRTEICATLGLSQSKVQKALQRWKDRYDPELCVGKEHQYKNSGSSLRKRALKRNLPIVDGILNQGKSTLEVAIELDLSHGHVKSCLRQVCASFKPPSTDKKL